MRRLAVCASLALAAALAGCGAPPPRSASAAPVAAPAPKEPPRLIVAISVDQFSADLFAQYRRHFTRGLARLQQGAVFPSGYQSHAATETCPGHSTLLTGTHPARNGVIANNWFDLSLTRADKRVYCAEDVTDPASTSRDPVVSARNLKVPTLGELMKAANPATRNVAVSAKDRAVMMMGGHRIDAAYWWKNGQFVTLKGRELSPAAVAQNVEVAALLKTGAPALDLPAFCAGADNAVPVGKATLGTGRFALEPGKPDAVRISPRMDHLTVELANRLVDELNLGKGDAPDILSVSLSATDYIGHATGTNGAEICIQMAELDKAVGALLDHLDARGIDYAVMLTSDHGGLDMPERASQQAVPRAVRVDNSLMARELAKTVTARTGIASPGGPLLYSDGGEYYVNAALAPAQKAEVVKAMVAILRAHPQVAAVYTAEEMAKTPLPTGNAQDWSIRDRTRASFDASRSGDVLILLDRAVTPIPEAMPGAYVATHGSVYDYDRRVPMLFWRRGMRAFEQPAPVETVDIAPTLAALVGLRVSEGMFDGRCLDLDGGADNTCGAK
ncbi:alkaline phosphatase family protein [Novosphingobium sp.]|uniref:alkaline phosphatase family protein n=1 Tax=Novosphingobium sp. TaxID=1874826 RepID=UPI001EBF17DF|nr:alkaline phosphatase family protein [Novosphingobium sp.]MBK6801868.1 alkaline phosphatase family protein [Novosphingobium sp.]MBK9010290.1 alkaline phosphatase family protein [Novosphingobium sp.]